MHRPPTIRLSNTAIDVHGQQKIASYGLSRYRCKMSVNFLLKHFLLRVLYTTLYFVILQLLFSVCVPCNLQAQKPSKPLQPWQIEGLKSAFFQPDSDVKAEMVKFCPPGFFSGLDKEEAKKFCSRID